MDITNRKLVLNARPDGLIKDTDFRVLDDLVRPLEKGEILIKTMYLSLAPVMKFYMIDGAGIEAPLAIGDTMRGRGVGEVIESQNDSFAVGDIVQGKFGWQEYVISSGTAYDMMYQVNTHGLSPSTALGVLGVTGCTSYLGLYDVGELKENDVVLVSSAAGGVGSLIGQLAKIKGATAIGMSSTDEKCTLLTDKLGYQAAINYRTEDVSQRISELCPDGIDVFFDNVGGEILDIALLHLTRYARVVECGRISTYKKNLREQDYQLKNWHMIGATRSKMIGFFIYDYEAKFAAAIQDMSQWIKEGKLVYQEDILEGIERMPEALNRLFEGKNVGKQLVKIS